MGQEVLWLGPCEAALKTTVIVSRGRQWRGRRGWIAGDLDHQNPFATRVAMFAGADVAAIDIAMLDRADRQLELALPDAQTKTPPA